MSDYIEVCRSSDREAWLEARSGLLTASDVAAALGFSKWKSPLELWLEKTGQAERKEFSDEQQDRMSWGLVVEDSLLRWYAVRTMRPIRKRGVLLKSTKYPWLGATEDGETDMSGVKDAPVEAKNTNIRLAEDWAEGMPDYYLPQVETQCIVKGKPAGSSVVCIGGAPPLWTDVELTAERRDMIVDGTRDFMRRVEEMDPPEPDGSESSRYALSRMFPSTDHDSVSLGQDAVDWDERIAELNKIMKSANRECEELKQKIQMALGEKEEGVLPGNLGRWTWSEVSRNGYTVEPKTYRQLRRRKAA